MNEKLLLDDVINEIKKGKLYIPHGWLHYEFHNGGNVLLVFFYQHVWKWKTLLEDTPLIVCDKSYSIKI